jgi:uncharacterized membrane protein
MTRGSLSKSVRRADETGTYHPWMARVSRETHSHRTGAVWFALACVYVIWSTTYLAIRVTDQTLPPLVAAGIRFLVAGSVLYVIAITNAIGFIRPRVKRIVELAGGKYKGFNDHHLSEKLGSEEKITLCREKLRQLLRAHGICSPRKRRGIKHRSRRERRAAEGMMLQVDGSSHDWLEGRGPRLCLIGAIDDATGKSQEAVGCRGAAHYQPAGCSAQRMDHRPFSIVLAQARCRLEIELLTPSISATT